MPFAIDLPHRVDNIPLSRRRCLNPVFEAISNSIHAVEEAGKGQDGRIDVHIVRDTSQSSLDGKPILNQPVTGFTIIDNGIGFTDDNLDSFQTSDTRRKADRGGKGVGRLLWLKAFEKARIESTYRGNGTKLTRTFDFQLTQEGTENFTLQDAGEDAAISTTVALLNYRSHYRNACPVRFGTIANRIIEHFLQYFALGDCPQITLHDDYEQTTESLNRLFKSELMVGGGQSKVTIAGHSFSIRHVRLRKSDARFLGRVPKTARRRQVSA